MIDRQHGRILIECDSCDEVFHGDRGAEFSEVWAAAKRDGWCTRLIGRAPNLSEWVHGCPKCGV